MVDMAAAICPITQEVMEDPVVCADGHSYERSAIEKWLQTKSTSPSTNAPLLHKNLVPNHALRNLIDAGVSCNACVMISFSDEDGIRAVQERLAAIHPGILKSLELEEITLFPKVAERLEKAGLKPTRARLPGRRTRISETAAPVRAAKPLNATRAEDAPAIS